MKRFITLVMVLTVLMGCVMVPMEASAETLSGTTSKTVTFKFIASRKNAYFVLSASKGVARVAEHNIFGWYKKDGNENVYGFYKVTMKGKNFNKSLIWGPSATTNKKGVMTCREVQILAPAKGTYTVTITPLSNNAAAKYWKYDMIRYWVRPASWRVSVTSACTVKK